MVPLSIYIHWPFCKSKCPYCDFNSHVRANVDHIRWRKALLKELASYANKLQGREVVSIFFGGGTPSLMESETVAALISAVSDYWKTSDTIEITLEANPTSVEAEKFKAFRAAGVNRVSLGVQSLYADELKFLGREHSADEALKAVALARDLFPRMSFDLIYARPGQTLAAWEKELTRALTFTKGHLSLYQLTIEENTAFHHAYHSGKFVLPEDNLAADMYELTERIIEAHGMKAYEVSNYAAPGEESRHNLTYWKSDDYIGIGPGAHGRYRVDGKRIATEAMKSPERWLQRVETDQDLMVEARHLSDEESMEEALMMGLRLTKGIEFADWKMRTGIDLKRVLSAETLTKLQDQNLLIADEHNIKTTLQGRLLLNSITRELLANASE